MAPGRTAARSQALWGMSPTLVSRASRDYLFLAFLAPGRKETLGRDRPAVLQDSPAVYCDIVVVYLSGRRASGGSCSLGRSRP